MRKAWDEASSWGTKARIRSCVFKIRFIKRAAGVSKKRLLSTDKRRFFWSEKRDSNPQHSAWEADALPLNYSRNVTYYTPRKSFLQAYFEKKCRRKPIFYFGDRRKRKNGERGGRRRGIYSSDRRRRRFLKKADNCAAHSSSSTPPSVSGLWL